jgi:hypothetical protein
MILSILPSRASWVRSFEKKSSAGVVDSSFFTSASLLLSKGVACPFHEKIP